ncbi:GDSL esterase/lipase At4g16230-like [Chenopodium quinoa]|uniref:GDSL esterase/lipase At4g16230-like n=1 Tax=Chenopodium quinoa TaxID=63459 RepID=UPI000B77B96D|nr:GDSL esterase/lipase At4g16230-like [Chenopodium quinoa]
MGSFQNKQRTLIILMLISLSMLSNHRSYGAEEQIANFVFGDSDVDVGNNNYIVSLLKANSMPNGIDYEGPTGRFTNGRTVIDIIAQTLGKFGNSPPYLAPTTKGSVILKGVNYASGGAGILNETGSIFIGRINFDAQLDNFANTKQDIIAQIGEAATNELMNKAFFSVVIGANDFIANYLLPVIIRGHILMQPDAFIDTMISKFRLQLTRLYNMGARKILVTNVPQIGCTPFERRINLCSGNQCAAYPNQLAQLYNVQLKSLLTELNSNLKGSKFLYGDAYGIFTDFVYNYRSYGMFFDSYICHLVFIL